MWGTQTLMCQLENGVWRNENGESYTGTTKGTVTRDATTGVVTRNHIHTAKMAQVEGYMFWDPFASASEVAAGYSAGSVIGCSFPPKNLQGTGSHTTSLTSFTDEFVGSGAFNTGADAELSDKYGGSQGYTGGLPVITVQGKSAMHAKGFVEYVPFKGRLSIFYDTRYLEYAVDDTTLNVPGAAAAVPEVYYTYEPFSGVVIPAATTASTTSMNADGYTSVGQVQSTLADVKFPNSTNTGLASTGLGSTVFTAATYKSLVYSTSTLNNNMTWDSAFIGTGDNGVAASAMPTGDGVNLVPRMSSFLNSAGKLSQNVMSRMLQKEALHHAQCAVFISIIVVQWADLM